MRIVALTTLVTVAGLALAGGTQAQPAGEAPGRGAALPASPPPEYGLPLTNEQAKAAAEGAIAEAKKNNWHMAIAVVGTEGELIYFEKMDGTQSSSALLAQAKARTSALFRRASKVFADQFAARPWLSGERVGALDVLAATVSKWSGARQALASSRPQFAALLARIDAEPRVAAVWARHWPRR